MGNVAKLCRQVQKSSLVFDNVCVKTFHWELRWAWCPVDGLCYFHQNGVPLVWQGQLSDQVETSSGQELIRWNPWANFKRLPVRQKIVSVDIRDFRILYRAMPEWLQWASKTAFCLALRFGIVELFSLKWSSFDWRRCSVHVRQGKSGAIKTVFPPDAYLREAEARYAQDREVGQEYVCHRRGKQILNYGKAWQTVCEKTGIRMRPYDIRHLAATEMLAGGADLASVAAQLGHSSVTTTGRTYAHVTAGGQTRAAGFLPAI